MRTTTLAATIVLSLLFLLCVSSVANAALPGYSYVKTHTIQGSTDGAQSNYQVKFTVYSGTGTDSGQAVYLNGHSLNWPNDIRFTDSNDVLLSFWVESSDSNSATVWVKVPSIPASPGNTTVKLYYGKAGEASASNGGSTFPFFDDFVGSSYDTSKWTLSGSGSGYATVANGELSVGQSDYSGADFRSVSTWGSGYAMRARIKSKTGLTDSFSFFNPPFQTTEVYVTDKEGRQATYRNNGASVGSFAYTAQSYGILEAMASGSHLDYYFDGANHAGVSNFAGGSGQISVHANHGGGFVVDWVMMRAYTYNEPTHGAWETPITPPVANFNAFPVDGTAPLSVQFNDTSAENPTAWQWDFGDGTANSTAQNPQHTFTGAGTYTVILTASNGGGSSTLERVNYISVSLPSDVLKAAILMNTSVGFAPMTVQFTDNSSGNPTAWQWNFGDGTANSTAQNPQHTFTGAGNYTITLTASNAYDSNTTYVGVFVFIPPPTVNFTANMTSGTVPFTVQFTDTSMGGPAAWRWYFGDGAVSTLQNPQHTYDTPGIYNVTLEVSNANGMNGTMKAGYINATAPVPAASFISNTIPAGMDNYISYPVTVTVVNTGTMVWSADDGFALGAGNGDATVFNNFPIGMAAGTVVQPGQQYTFSFTMKAPSQYGTYNPQYRMAWGGHGMFGDALSQSVYVENAYNATYVLDNIPSSVVSYSNGGTINVAISMKNTGTKTWITYPDGSNPVVGVDTLSRSDVATFGQTTSNPCEPGSTHTFYGHIVTNFNPGFAEPEFQLRLPFCHFGPVIRKTIEFTSSGSTSIPKTSFMANPPEGMAPLLVQFTDKSSNSPTSWQWNFGDGSANSTAQNPTHAFNNAGTYEVTLTVSNSQGSDTASMVIKVHTGLYANFVYDSDGNIYAPLTVSFTDNSGNYPTAWQWSFGDGGTSTQRNPQHTYMNPGIYTVTLTVTNSIGDTATDHTTIPVYQQVVISPEGTASDFTETTEYPDVINATYYYSGSDVICNGAVWVPQVGSSPPAWYFTFGSMSKGYGDGSPLAQFMSYSTEVTNNNPGQEFWSIPERFADGSPSFTVTPDGAQQCLIADIGLDLIGEHMDMLGENSIFGRSSVVTSLLGELGEPTTATCIRYNHDTVMGTEMYLWPAHNPYYIHEMVWQQCVLPGQDVSFTVTNKFAPVFLGTGSWSQPHAFSIKSPPTPTSLSEGQLTLYNIKKISMSEYLANPDRYGGSLSTEAMNALGNSGNQYVYFIPMPHTPPPTPTFYIKGTVQERKDFTVVPDTYATMFVTSPSGKHYVGNTYYSTDGVAVVALPDNFETGTYKIFYLTPELYITESPIMSLEINSRYDFTKQSNGMYVKDSGTVIYDKIKFTPIAI